MDTKSITNKNIDFKKYDTDPIVLLGDFFEVAMPLSTSLIVDNKKTFILNLLIGFSVIQILKVTTRIPRPNDVTPNFIDDDLSFPSGHSWSASASALFLHFNKKSKKKKNYKNLSKVFLLFSLFTGYSRIYSYKHRLIDVLTSYTMAYYSSKNQDKKIFFVFKK